MESVTEKIPQPMTHTHIHPLTHISKIGAARINNTSPECGPILHRLTFRYEHVSIIVLNQSIILSNYLLANFRGLVLGCIEAKVRNQILVRKLFTRSIILLVIVLCTSPTPKIQQTFATD